MTRSILRRYISMRSPCHLAVRDITSGQSCRASRSFLLRFRASLRSSRTRRVGEYVSRGRDVANKECGRVIFLARAKLTCQATRLTARALIIVAEQSGRNDQYAGANGNNLYYERVRTDAHTLARARTVISFCNGRTVRSSRASFNVVVAREARRGDNICL